MHFIPALSIGSRKAVEKTCIHPARTINSGFSPSAERIFSANAASYLRRPSAIFCSSFSPFCRKPWLIRLKYSQGMPGRESVSCCIPTYRGAPTSLIRSNSGVCILPVRNERDDPTVWKSACGYTINEGLEVRAKARGHDQDATRRNIRSGHCEECGD